jgi:microsomal epoxide hydrolase
MTVNFLPSFTLPEEAPNGEPLSESEEKVIAKAKIWTQEGNGYALEHDTRPVTIGFVVNSNPLSLFWHGELIRNHPITSALANSIPGLVKSF